MYLYEYDHILKCVVILNIFTLIFHCGIFTVIFFFYEQEHRPGTLHPFPESASLNPLPPGEGEISLPHSRAIFGKLKNEDKDLFSFRNCNKMM